MRAARICHQIPPVSWDGQSLLLCKHLGCPVHFNRCLPVCPPGHLLPSFDDPDLIDRRKNASLLFAPPVAPPPASALLIPNPRRRRDATFLNNPNARVRQRDAASCFVWHMAQVAPLCPSIVIFFSLSFTCLSGIHHPVWQCTI